MPINIVELKQADIFAQLTPDQLEKIACACVEKIFNNGDIIIEEGAHSDELYIIAQGEVDILLDPSLVRN